MMRRPTVATVSLGAIKTNLGAIRWSLDGPNAGSGVFSVVLERRADGWKVIHDHTSSDP